MPRSTPSALLRYGLAALAYALALGTTHALRQAGVSFDSTSLIILTMIGSAWYGGLGPGLMVAALFEATLDYYAGFPHVPLRFVSFNRFVLFGSVAIFASARRGAEMRLRQQGDRLEAALTSERAARAQAETANRLKDEFLATVSHELRTPLNTILGWATILNRHSLEDAMKDKAVRAIERSAQAQTHIVEDLLDFSGIVKGRLRVDSKPVALAPIVVDAVETIRLSAETKRLTLDVVTDDEAIVRGDPDRLQQIAWNLLANAVKFTPPGGRIGVRMLRVDRTVELTVTDTGVGIDPDFLPHVFEPFRQQDSSMTRPHGGLGLGLALARQLAELHGGTIAAKSQGPGHGASFTLRLPLAAEPEVAAIPPANRERVSPA